MEMKKAFVKTIELNSAESSTSKKVRLDIEAQKPNEGNHQMQINVNDEEYLVNAELREKFPNSYFLSVIYDDAIWGINPINQSIIYDTMVLGFLHVWHVEGSYPDLGDRIECASIIINRVERLTAEKLDGKVKPSFLFIDKDIEHFDWLKESLEK